MIKIGLFLSATPSMGGAFQYSQTLFEAIVSLPRDDFKVVVAFTGSCWFRQLRHSRVKLLRVPYYKWTFGAGAIVTLTGFPLTLWRKICTSIDPTAKLLLKEQCDLWLFSSYSFVAYQMPVRSVGVVHDLMHRYERQFPEVSSFGVYTWREKVFKRLCRHTVGILVDSELGRSQLGESYGIDLKRVSVLPFIAPKYLSLDKPKRSLDKKYKLPPKFIFYPAQFWDHKNHLGLIKAVAKIRPQCPDIQLVLLGSKKHRGYKKVNDAVSKLGISEHVSFLGHVDEDSLARIYRRARALIMPTFFGPTNIPPLEAFASGCPVAVSGVYGMPEQVGDAGLLFDPNSIEEIAMIVSRLWTDDMLCEALAKKGIKRAEQWGQPQFNERFKSILMFFLSGNGSLM